VGGGVKWWVAEVNGGWRSQLVGGGVKWWLAEVNGGWRR